MKKYVIALPILLFLIFWSIDYIPYGFKLMNEPGDPWYSPYTTTIYLLLIGLFYPALVASDFLGLKHMGTGFQMVTFIYSVALSFIINTMWKYFCKKG